MDTNVKQHARTSDLSSVQWHSCDRMHAHLPAYLAQRTHIPGMRPATSGAPGGRLLARGGHLGRENGAHHTRARGVARCVQKDGQQSTRGKSARLHRGRGNDQDAKHGGGLVFLTGKLSGFRRGFRSQKCVRRSSWCSSGGSSSTRARSRAGSTRSYLRVWRRVVLWLCAPVSLLCTRSLRSLHSRARDDLVFHDARSAFLALPPDMRPVLEQQCGDGFPARGADGPALISSRGTLWSCTARSAHAAGHR